MLLDICKKLTYRRLDISISPKAEVIIEGWLGGLIRNNLLYAAEQVQTPEGDSLLSELERFPLPESHPLAAILKGGFPKSFAIAVLSPVNMLSFPLKLQEGETIVFSLVLIGQVSRYYKEFVEAVRLMCNKGIGTPQTPLVLHEICEKDGWGRSNRIAVEHSDKIAPLRFPVCPEDYREEQFGRKEKVVRLQFRSPMLLAVPSKKKDRTLSYQDKMNAFPSFYQFVRSAIFRGVRLSALYACPGEVGLYQRAMEEVETYLEGAASALLMKANIRWVRIPGPRRNDGRPPMLFSGYVGELVFVGDFSEYVPFLSFMQALGNGNETVYGLGHFQIGVLEYTEKD